ncbi:hypothetical protein [Thermoproteus tenax]|uniref:Uncharacterized protein n=1 Tax=Thermoproteus tenax (strain ATCC 35583 / DSM 2078 / JCM 9277 / NBRC 100435 / Kra 1) TaxID=768679 RepID=G4RKW0_THETK|nr:hypothetical protein [Thermoproteus tenax]CCC82205.1 hypothetical protein TTX_1579 [Thermoproteus tenax Kra 1]
MSRKIFIVREGDLRWDADIVIDARPPYEFYDVILFRGRELKSLIAVGETRGGSIVAWGKYTGRPVAALLNGVLYIRAVPLSLYEALGYVAQELEDAKGRDELREIVEKLKKVVVEERRRYKRSKSLLALQKYVDGEAELPSYLADLIGHIDRDRLAKALEVLYGEIY